MAGAFGFEREHYDVSMACGERSLLPAVRAAEDDTIIVADGFSCREQIRQATPRDPRHLAEVLRLALSHGRARWNSDDVGGRSRKDTSRVGATARRRRWKAMRRSAS